MQAYPWICIDLIKKGLLICHVFCASTFLTKSSIQYLYVKEVASHLVLELKKMSIDCRKGHYYKKCF
jgi:hypothetical protein